MFNISYSKVMWCLALLILGMSLIGYGMLTLNQPKKALPMSDAEIIMKAKDLGLVEARDIYIEKQENK